MGGRKWNISIHKLGSRTFFFLCAEVFLLRMSLPSKSHKCRLCSNKVGETWLRCQGQA